MPVITAKQIRAKLQAVTDETSEAFAQFNAIGELRRKVEQLRRESTEGEDDAACEAAARELVRASEDLRLAEIMAPRRQAARDAAASRRTDAALGAIRSAMHHFEALNNEAREAAQQVVWSLPSPAVLELRHEEGGLHRDITLTGALNLMPGVYESGVAYSRCYASHNTASAAENNAETILESFDATTATVRKQIAEMKKILAVIHDGEGGETASNGGGPVSPSAVATADAGELVQA